MDIFRFVVLSLSCFLFLFPGFPLFLGLFAESLRGTQQPWRPAAIGRPCFWAEAPGRPWSTCNERSCFAERDRLEEATLTKQNPVI